MEASEVNIPQPEASIPKPEGSSNILKTGADKLLSFFHRNEKKIEENPREVLEAVANDDITQQATESNNEASNAQIVAESEVKQPEVSEKSELTIDKAAALVSETDADKVGFTKWKDLASEWAKNPAVMGGVFAVGLGLMNMIGNMPMDQEITTALQMVSKAITAEGGLKSKIAKGLIAGGASGLVSEMVGNELLENVGEEALAKGREVLKGSETAQKVEKNASSALKSGRNRVQSKIKFSSGGTKPNLV